MKDLSYLIFGSADLSPLAVPVKQADLQDNLWQVNQTGGDAEKYRRELNILRDGKNGR